jgi:hypothetical protein
MRANNFGDTPTNIDNSTTTGGGRYQPPTKTK